MAKFAKGDRVVILGGRHQGRRGRVSRPTEVTTSMNEVGLDGSGRIVRVPYEHLVRILDPRQTTWEWLTTPGW